MTGDIRRCAAVVPVILLVAACGRPPDASPRREAASVEVRVAPAAARALARTFEAGGIVRARSTAQLSSRIVAEVREIRVQPGDRVARGQIVALLDDRDLAARRAQAQASLSVAQSSQASAEAEGESAEARLVLARANHQRIAQLREKNSATVQELDQVTAELRLAEAALRAASARLGEASASIAAGQAADRAADIAASFSAITAPFEGLVTSRLIEPGNMASPGLPLLTIETTDAFRLEVQIDETRARSLQTGQSAVVVLDGVGLDGVGTVGTAIGRVVEIARAVDPASHAFVVKVQLPADAGVRSGMFGRARFEIGKREALVVPASALLRRGQLSLVFVVGADGRARMRAVTAGATYEDATEVLAGVQAGEAVVLSPPPSLIDGTAVRVAGGRP